jgi:hypothetical protein
MNLPARTNPYSMMDAILILMLAYRIHGTDSAIRAAAHNVRDKVPVKCRPSINLVIRCSSPTKWAENICKDDSL